MPIYLVFALNLFNGAGVQATRVVLPLFALDLGAGPISIGFLAATFSIFPMLLAVPVGKFADRFGSRWLVIFGIVCSGLGMLLPYFVPGIPAIFSAAMLVGFSTSICNVSLQNLAGLLSAPQDRAKNFSNYSLVGSTTNFLGPLIAGFSIEHAGYGRACLLLALLSLVPVVLLAVWGGVLPKGTRQPKHADNSSGRSSVLSTLSEPAVRKVLATGSLQNTGESLFLYYMPVYTHAIGLPASTIGMVLAMNSAAAFVVRLILPRMVARFKEERVLAFAFFVGAATLLSVPFFENAVILALLSFIFGLGMGAGGPIVTMLMFASSPDGRSGETLGLKITVNHFTKVVTPVVFGSIASAFGLPPIFWLSALLLGGGGFLSYPSRKR